MTGLPRFARARVGHLLDGFFELNHDTGVATLTRTFPNSVPNMAPWYGIHAECEGDTIRLMERPFNGTAVFDVEVKPDGR